MQQIKRQAIPPIRKRVKDGATGGRTEREVSCESLGHDECPIEHWMPDPLPVAEFECWTCLNGLTVYKSYAGTIEECRRIGHDVRPAGGKRP